MTDFAAVKTTGHEFSWLPTDLPQGSVTTGDHDQTTERMTAEWIYIGGSHAINKCSYLATAHFANFHTHAANFFIQVVVKFVSTNMLSRCRQTRNQFCLCEKMSSIVDPTRKTRAYNRRERCKLCRCRQWRPNQFSSHERHMQSISSWFVCM
jgi:hypothetical protein